MPRHLIHLTLVTAVLLLGGSFPAVAQQTQGTGKPPAKVAPAAKVKRVDINSASRAELKTLPGIGDAEAERIMAARPYPSKAKLAADKVLPMETYAALKGRIVAVQKAQPKPKAMAKGKPAVAPASTPAGKS
jgi:competence protein ComEA